MTSKLAAFGRDLGDKLPSWMTACGASKLCCVLKLPSLVTAALLPAAGMAETLFVGNTIAVGMALGVDWAWQEYGPIKTRCCCASNDAGDWLKRKILKVALPAAFLSTGIHLVTHKDHLEHESTTQLYIDENGKSFEIRSGLNCYGDGRVVMAADTIPLNF